MIVAVVAFMTAMSVGIAVTWTRDILSAARIDRPRGRLRARGPGSNSLLLPHWLAGYGTAAGLTDGSLGLLGDRGRGRGVSLLALGALVYTSVSSLGWAPAVSDRRGYAARWRPERSAERWR